MSSKILVSLFVTVVFWNVVQVISSDDDGTLHLGAHDDTSQDTTTNGDVAGEWTFFVNVSSFDSFTWSFEA